MAHHPRGMTVDIVGTEQPGNGRSYKEHAICGSVLEEDSVVRIRHVQVTVHGLEKPALTCFWVSNGIDQCHVGFLPRNLVKHWQSFEGRLAQVVEVYSRDSDSTQKKRKYHHDSGCCKAVLIDTKFGDDADDDIFSPVKWREVNAGQGEDTGNKGVVKGVVKEEEGYRNHTESELDDDDDNDDDDDDDDDDNDDDNNIFAPVMKETAKRKAAVTEGDGVEEEEIVVTKKKKKKKERTKK